jgi:hypothetical protein
MLKQSIRRKPGQVLAVLAAVMSLSGLAEAQQSGMFPMHAIRRERTPCANEDPIYKLYRNQYYGYFPTQWRRFPDGWSLSSPEGPHTAEELKKNPIEGPKPFAPEGEGEEMQGPAAPPTRPAIPNPPPDERSPFEMDRPEAAPGAAPGRTNPAARGTTPPPAAEPSPFDVPETKPAPAGAAPGDRPQASRPNRPSPPALPDQAGPDLAPPGDAPAAPPRTSWNRRRDSRQNDSGPLLSMSDATLPTVEETSSPDDPSGAGGAQTIASNTSASEPVMAAPALQPQPTSRRGPISSLFAGLGWNWLRR